MYLCVHVLLNYILLLSYYFYWIGLIHFLSSIFFFSSSFDAFVELITSF